MNRIDRLFQEKKSGVLSIYLTAGYPGLGDTGPLIRTLQKNGADMVEVGIPFSDPMADGPVIQHSSHIALRNGMNLDLLLKQVEEVRPQVTIPLILMGYFNPIHRMGMEPFLERCQKAGIDGVIIPDLPPDEYELHYMERFKTFGIHHILLVTPQTSEERINRIAALSGGFLYMVASASTTGARESISGQQEHYFKRIAEMDLPLPRLIGFGISSRDTFESACRYAEGAIIGSAFIEAIGAEGPLESRVMKFMRRITAD
ncbi:MAG: tryptophan synthase subunit alpha [Bacteroidales bacterium]